MLASDLNNPEFVNPTNPDATLHVQFFWKEPVSKWQSEIQGKEVRLPKMPFIRIMKPGDNTSIFETAVRDDHKARFPRHWLAWQIKEGMIEGSAEAIGWKIEEWDAVNKNETQIYELKHMRFNTVEQIAGASDAQIQRMGIGGIGLREQARKALKDRNLAEYKTEMDAKDKQIADMRAEQVAMKAQLARLEQMLPVSVKDTLHIQKKG